MFMYWTDTKESILGAKRGLSIHDLNFVVSLVYTSFGRIICIHSHRLRLQFYWLFRRQ